MDPKEYAEKSGRKRYEDAKPAKTQGYNPGDYRKELFRRAQNRAA